MGLSMLPDELLVSLMEQWPCREPQLRQLAALLSPSLPSPSSLVIYGPRATGKSGVTQACLERSKLLHAIVRCHECVTGRHLLERTVGAVYASLHARDSYTGKHPGRCENLGALSVHLQTLLEQQSKFVLVLDGVDRQREAPPTLLPALARLAESIPPLSIVMIVSHPPPRFLHQAGVPHLHFGPYTRGQSIRILAQHPPDIFLEPPPAELDYDDETHAEDKDWLFPRFCAAVWDALAQGAARDLIAYRDLCHKLWRPFLAPVIKGDFGTRDFSRLLVAQRRLFQDDAVLLDAVITTPDAACGLPSTKRNTHELPYYAKWLLVAAYLASYNPVKLDALYFMKNTEKKRKKKGGGTARSGGRPSQIRKIPRHLLAAAAFPLDRLLAILHAILPDDIRTTVDVYKQIATLSSLRLLVRAGGIGSSDPLEPGGKWRVGSMITWEHVQSLARSIDFNLLDYVAE